jgi:hypothetical protein
LLTGRIPYTAYLPSDSGYICQQIIHHQECEKYYLIEEGLASYNPPGATPVVTKPPSLYRKFKSHIRISLQARGKISLPHTMHLIWEKKYSGALGSNDLVFPDFPIPVVNLNCKLFTAKNSNITKILVLDDISIYTKDEQNAYLAAMQQVIASATVENDRWAYKIHPNCEKWPWLTMTIENIYRDTLENNSKIQRLETEECIEDLGLGANVTTYAFMSSCLFYIHQCGGNVVSLKELLFSTHPTFKKAWRTYIPHNLDRLLTSHPSFSGA